MEIPRSTGETRNNACAYPVTKGQAREFMRHIATEEFIWEKLLEQGGWGGHLHRAILSIAVMEGSDEDEVDIVPLYVEEYVKRPPHYQKYTDQDALRALALRHANSCVIDVAERHAQNVAYDPQYVARRDHALEEFEATFAYFGTRTEMPYYVATAFDEATNRRIMDKYFYPHNSITGERYDTPLYPEDSCRPIPEPNTN